MKYADEMKRIEQDSEKFGVKDMRAPVVIRLDGWAFHTWVKEARCSKPFDERMIYCMQYTALELCRKIQTAVMAFVQSDEISIVLRNDTSENSEPWFDNRIQKLCSLSASMAGCLFNKVKNETFGEDVKDAFFDSRVMYMPDRDAVLRCLTWRQLDCIRNSISGLAQSQFSQKQLLNKKSEDMKAMLVEKGADWNDLETEKKYGALVHKTSTVGNYNGVEFTRKVFFVDKDFGLFDQAKFDEAYDYCMEKENAYTPANS